MAGSPIRRPFSFALVPGTQMYIHPGPYQLSPIAALIPNTDPATDSSSPPQPGPSPPQPNRSPPTPSTVSEAPGPSALAATGEASADIEEYTRVPNTTQSATVDPNPNASTEVAQDGVDENGAAAKDEASQEA